MNRNLRIAVFAVISAFSIAYADFNPAMRPDPQKLTQIPFLIL